MKIWILTLSVLIYGSASGQKIPEIGMDVRITESDKTIVAEIKTVNTDIEVEPGNTYYWYGGGSIHQTQGGYSGRLLNGTYNEYYLNKNLKSQGYYNKGLYDGVWKNWNENGVLKLLTTYRKGIKSGAFVIYDDLGKPVQAGDYDHGLMDGKIVFYDKDASRVVTYKEGKPQPEKPATKFWDKLNIFKKHPKANTVKPATPKTKSP